MHGIFLASFAWGEEYTCHGTLPTAVARDEAAERTKSLTPVFGFLENTKSKLIGSTSTPLTILKMYMLS